MKRAMISLSLLLAFAGCEKSSPFTAKGSGDLTSGEKSLLGDLPGGNAVLFGGNYMKFQKYLSTSPLGKMMVALNQQSPGMSAWVDCFATINGVTMMGGVKVAADTAQMRFVMKGVALPAIKACADKAGFTSTIDADNKFISLEMPSAMGPLKTGYLVLPDGALLTSQSLPIGGRGVVPVERAMIEADANTLTTGNALLADKALAEAVVHLNRGESIWFAGSGQGTPIADKVGLVKGTVDIASGLSFDFVAQILDKGVRDQMAKGIPQLKQQAGMMGPEVAEVVKALKFDQSGDQVHLSLKITNAQLEGLLKKMGGMMPGMGGGL